MSFSVHRRPMKVERVEVVTADIDHNYARVELSIDGVEFEFSGPDAQVVGSTLNTAGGGDMFERSERGHHGDEGQLDAAWQVHTGQSGPAGEGRRRARQRPGPADETVDTQKVDKDGVLEFKGVEAGDAVFRGRPEPRRAGRGAPDREGQPGRREPRGDVRRQRPLPADAPVGRLVPR
jgi:hypothetical protein